MKETIIKILKHKNKAFTLEDIDNALNLITPDEYNEMVETVKELEEEGILYHTNKDK